LAAVLELREHNEPVQPEQRRHGTTFTNHQGSPLVAALDSRINSEAPGRVRGPLRTGPHPDTPPRFIAESPLTVYREETDCRGMSGIEAPSSMAKPAGDSRGRDARVRAALISIGRH